MISIVQGSILDFEGDTIVNPANSFLRHGAGLAKVIADAAAPPDSHKHVRGRWWAEQRHHPSVPTGACAWTSAGALPYKGIIHAVGPIYGGGTYFEAELLERVHESVIETAWNNNCKSVAIPAISCGLFRFPVELAAGIALSVAKGAWDGYPLDISFYLFEDSHVEAYNKALALP